MLGPRYVLTSYQKKLFNMDYEKHKKRLTVIKSNKRGINDDSEKVFRATFSELQQKHHNFQNSEKIGSIDKTNQVLLDKLVKISKNQKPPLFKTTNHWTHPGTLNTNFRKRELEKIAMENESMAKRLISQHGSVNVKKLEVDFEKHREFGKNVQKVASPMSTAYGKLPAIQSPKSVVSPKKKQNKKKRSQTVDNNAEEVAALETQESQHDEPQRVETQTEAQEEAQKEASQQEVKPEGKSEEKVEAETAQPVQLSIPLENTSQVHSQSANRSQQDIKEEKAQTNNQITQRSKEENKSSHVKSSGEISVSQVDEERKEDKAATKSNRSSPPKENERNTKRSGTLQVSSKFLGDSTPRRTSTQTQAKKVISKVDKSETNTQRSKAGEAQKSERKEEVNEAPKSERKEERAVSVGQVSNKENEKQEEEALKENKAEEDEGKSEDLAAVKEGDGESNE